MRYLVALLFAGLLVACEQSENPAPEAADTKPAPATEAQAQAQQAEQDIRGEEVSYQVGDTTLTGYMAYDANQTGPRPGVLIVHEWWGHNDYVRTRAHMLAKLGYTAFALDMYGEGKQADHPEDAQKFMTEVMNNMEMAEQRFLAAKTLLTQHETTNPEQVAAIGYCFGGGVVLHMARQGMDLDGVASFHGTLSTETPAKAHAVKADVLVLHGADDPFVPQEQVDAFKQEMAAAVADYRVIEYPNATHAFTNPGATALGEKFDLPLAYNEEVDEKSWNELKKFLDKIFAE